MQKRARPIEIDLTEEPAAKKATTLDVAQAPPTDQPPVTPIKVSGVVEHSTNSMNMMYFAAQASDKQH